MKLFSTIFLAIFLLFSLKAQTYTVSTPTIVGASTNYVQVITKAVFGNNAHTMGHSYLIDYSTNTIHLTSCYFYSPIFPVVRTLTNTVNVGILYQGNYTLSYIAYVSYDGTNCTPSDTIIFPSIPFYVGPNSINEFKIEQSIQIAPNPFKDNFKLICDDPNLIVRSALIFNSMGQKVKEIFEPKLNSEINTDLSQGIYFLEISSGIKSKRIKFIKE